MGTLRIKLDRLKLIERIEEAINFLQEYLPKMEEEYQKKIEDFEQLLEGLKNADYRQENAFSVEVGQGWKCKSNEAEIIFRYKVILPESKPYPTIEVYVLSSYIRTLQKAKRQLETCTVETVTGGTIKPIDDALAFYDSVKDK
ncbi:hypothetical protein Lepto7376_3874 [[Leptolyngbya] sp. PCC 7376]|uniref:hypothetical protein n=1 Tax=[Leptolyngbya] sp. PCC 7376 TaxID=111781 RepID=UPI00029ED40A|nr:hypothetical protein [[Leptolyngbya] sp. PCC 7376]AFY40030.1 hypothetical protein Lepto7376_3874 [[Leptolyngbya] sp. PCC 7376]